MITFVTEKETQLLHMLQLCNDVLKEVTKERDELKAEVTKLKEHHDHCPH